MCQPSALSRLPALTAILLGWILLPTAFGASAPGAADAWEVRRLRTSDAEKAGGHPGWDVDIVRTAEGVSATIAGDPGRARGLIMIGRRVKIRRGETVGLAFDYRTSCGLSHRSGDLAICIFTPEAWDALPREAETDVCQGQDRSLRPIWSLTVHRMTEDDVVDKRELSASWTRMMGLYAQSHAGRELVLGLRWMGAHTTSESAQFERLRLVKQKTPDRLSGLINALDLSLPELAGVKRAAEEGNLSEAAGELVRHFRQRFAGRERPTKIERGTLHEADMALEDRFRSCGSRDFFTLGTDFDWHRNAIDDKEWLLHLQWHHVLRTLVEAGAMRRDPRYTAKAVELLRDWIPKNLPGAPWSWRTLEVSLRAMNWTTIYPFLVAHDGFTRQDHVDVLFTLAEHLDYLLPPERFHSGHNFGASESRALLRVGTAMPEFKNAQKWRETAWERFQGEMAAQVLEDGAQVELTTGYHCGVTNSLTAAALEMRRLGTEPPSAYWNRLERMYEYSLLLTKPDGTQPSLGDSWGGRPLSFIRKGGELFERPDMVFVASNGKEGERPGFLDTRLPAAGYYVMRTSWTDNPNGIYLLLDAAHHWGGWHQHYDALGIVLYAYGKTLTPDAGPFAYDSPQRPVFQGTPAHSTLTVDEANQNTSPCVLHAMTGDSRLGIIDASQTGYAGVTHRRQVLFIRPTAESAPYVVLVDRVTGEGDHVLDLHFHLQESPVVTSQEQMSTRTVVADSANILTQAIWQHGVEFRPGSSWIMTGYGEKADRPDVVFRQTGSLPKAFVTLLIPTEDASAPRIAARVLGQPDVTGAIGVEVKAPWGTDTVQVGLQVGSMRVDGIEATARAVLHRADGKGTVMCRTILGE